MESHKKWWENFHWALNGGSPLNLEFNDWNSDVIVRILSDTEGEIKVPIISNGKDKLLFCYEYNNNWEGIMHLKITVNYKAVERLRVYENNPFATHCNSKLYCRFIGSKVPSSFFSPNDNYITLRIDMKGTMATFI